MNGSRRWIGRLLRSGRRVAFGKAGAAGAIGLRCPGTDEPGTGLSCGRGYWLILLASFAWVGAVVLAPFAASRAWAAGPLSFALFDRVCHQIPERSFFAFGHPLGVCHRCFGIYVGFACGLVVLPYLPNLTRRLLQRPRLVVLFFVPMLLDVIWPGNFSTSRFASGFVASFPVGLFLWAAVQRMNQTKDAVGVASGKPSVSFSQPGGWS